MTLSRWFFASTLLAVACTSPTSPSDAGRDAGAASNDATSAGDAFAPSLDAPGMDAVADAPMALVADHTSLIVDPPSSAAWLVLMGDSISASGGLLPIAPPAPRSPHRFNALLLNNDDAAYPSEATTDLTSLFGGAILVEDVALGGATTDGLRHAQLDELQRDLVMLGGVIHGHVIVAITIGGNDYSAGLRTGSHDPTRADVLGTAITNIAQVIAAFSSPTIFPDGVSIYLANVYDPTDGTGMGGNGCLTGGSVPQTAMWLAQWDTAYRDIAAEANRRGMHVSIVDARGHFHGHGYHWDDAANPFHQPDNVGSWINMSDCIHPNEAGHNELRRIFFEAIHPAYRVR